MLEARSGLDEDHYAKKELDVVETDGVGRLVVQCEEGKWQSTRPASGS